MRSWRWADFDPTAPDYERFPNAAEVAPLVVGLFPGEVLYIPSGTLHHVTNITAAVSFNIDWHTVDSARAGVASVFRGAPYKNGYYNMLTYIGLRLGVPAKLVLPLYRSYLTYIS